MRRIVQLLLVAILAITAQPTFAQNQSSSITLTVRAGYHGSYRLGEWFPVEVDIANDGPDLVGMLQWDLPGQRNEQTFQYPVELPRGSRKRIRMHVFSRGFERNGLVELLANGQSISRQLVALEPIDTNQFVVGVLSSDPTLLNSLDSMKIDGSNSTVVLHLSPDDLPEAALALRGLNVLFVHDTDTSQLSQAQRDAIGLWVSLGGQLIVSGGVPGQRAAIGLDPLLPAQVGSAINNSDLQVLAKGFAAPLPAEAANGPTVTLTPRVGAVDLSAGSGNIYRSHYGVGYASLASFDFALLRGWVSESALWQQIILPVPLFAPANGSRTNQTSILQSALQIPGLGLPSAWAILSFILAYILVVGPLNYVVLRRLRRLEWAWLSVPAIVLLFAGGLYLVGFSLRGNQSQLSQITVVQGTEGQPNALATGFIALFSPSRSNYVLGFPSDALVHETRGWDDVSAPVNPVIISSNTTELRNTLVDIASVRVLVAEASVNLPPIVSSQIQIDKNVISGEIRNSGSTALDHVMVVNGGLFIDIGVMQPGDSQKFSFANTARNFPWATALPESGLFNRKTLMNSLFNGDATLYANGSGPLGDDGVYLLAWSGEPTLPVRVNQQDQVQNGYTLYVIRLKS